VSEREVRELQKSDLFSSDLHEILYNGPSFLLGKIHHRLLYAKKTMHKLSYEEVEEDEYRFSTPISTEFGQEVCSNDIVWWIKRKESNVPELLEKTKKLLEKMDDFKHAVDKINIGKDEKYENVVGEIKEITNLHADTISKLYQYVEWLHSKDPLAPCILFNYKTWGSSPMNDRTIQIDISKQDPTDRELKACTEIACGLREITTYTAELGIATERFDNEIPYTTEFLFNYRIRISFEIRNNFHQYVEKIRIALQHIEFEIEKVQRTFELLNSKKFWRTNLSKIMKLSVEDCYYDFKKSLPMWNKPDNLEDVRLDFCEDIAALANSDGGVLIVGVSDKKPRQIFHIDKLEDRSKTTKQLILDKIKYDKDFTHFIQFSIDDNGTQKDCLVIGVEQTKKAVSVRKPDKSIIWPIRIKAGKDRSDQEPINKTKKKIASDNVDFMLVLEDDISN